MKNPPKETHPFAWSPGPLKSAEHKLLYNNFPWREIVIDCPPPPSTNRLWRYGRGHVYKSPEYERWRHEFFYHFRKDYPHELKLHGPFDVEILVSSKRRDVDNNAKALLDICEDLGIIENDKLAQRVTQERVEKDKAPLGCRLTITPYNKRTEDAQKQVRPARASKRKQEKKTD